MDPITAAINLIASITRLIAIMSEGQTPEQKKILWDWYIQDVTFWRKFLKIDQVK